MTGTVYLLGAGANQSVNAMGRVPPLARNFFAIAHDGEGPDEKARTAVYEYISRFWKKLREILLPALTWRSCLLFCSSKC